MKRYAFVFDYERDWMIVLYQDGKQSKYFNSAENDWDDSLDYVDIFLENGGNRYYYQGHTYDDIADIDIFSLKDEPIKQLEKYRLKEANKESENKVDGNNHARKESSTPMLDKMLSVKELSETCGEFLEWLMHRYDIFDPKVPKETFGYIGHGDYINKEQVLADFFGIDLLEVEKEKKMILKNLL